jgi:hypothetical protein
MMAAEQFGFRKGIYYNENAAYKLTQSAFKSLNQKGMLEEFYAI